MIENRFKVSVLICALNEEKNLPFLLPGLPSLVDEVILVDGHSTDNTVDIAKELRPDILVFYQPGKGKDIAMQYGFSKATGDIIVTMDADGSTDPSELPRLLKPLINGFHFSKGSRLASRRPEGMMPHRWLGNKLLAFLTNLLYGTNFTDVCCGYNAFWRKAFAAIDFSTGAFNYEPVIIVKAKKAGLNIAEVSCHDKGRITGTTKLPGLSQGLKAIKAILKERII